MCKMSELLRLNQRPTAQNEVLSSYRFRKLNSQNKVGGEKTFPGPNRNARHACTQFMTDRASPDCVNAS